jgi:hypothetical protein
LLQAAPGVCRVAPAAKLPALPVWKG